MTVQLFTPPVAIAVAVTMTPSAVEHVRKQLGEKPEALGIRLAISGIL